MLGGSLQRKSAGLYFAHFVVRRMKFASQVVRTVKHTSFKPQNLRHHLGLQAPLITDIFLCALQPTFIRRDTSNTFQTLVPFKHRARDGTFCTIQVTPDIYYADKETAEGRCTLREPSAVL